MKIALAGHLWVNHFRHVTGKNRNDVVHEETCPGGILWVSNLLRQAGLEFTDPAFAANPRAEHYECLETPVKEKKETRLSFRFLGCTPGTSQAAPEQADLLILLDEGFDPIELVAKSDVLLWASKERVPDKNTTLSFPQKTVLLLDGDLLRRYGALISRQLSWERTATDTVWQLMNNPAFRHLQAAAEILVVFAEEGCLSLRATEDGQRSASLYLSTGALEGTARSESADRNPMIWETVVSSIALSLVRNDVPVVPEMFPVAAEQRLRGVSGSEFVHCRWSSAVVSSLQKSHLIHCYCIPVETSSMMADQNYLSLLNQLSGTTMDELSERIVREGLSTIVGVPRIVFGKLVSIARGEMESFMNIRNLIAAYSQSDELRPLSIAVFGAPGSGKSFGVTQIAENSMPGLIQKIEFNVSQFIKRSDLAAALHKVRDVALLGKIPLVFFDEFDTDFEGQKLGWLKSFLMPMQDGKFIEGETEHPIGRCIFVFAGGTSSSAEQFCAPLGYSEDDELRRQFSNVKGPDFVSRLRGTLTVLGPNRSDERDKSFLLRRAALLRSLCERKLRSCFVGNRLCIDESVLTAMLLVPKYLHGARSMEAIIDMSRLDGASSWGPAALPADSQLALHVDAGAFTRLLLRDVLLASSREKLARQIHNNYQTQQQQRNSGNPTAWTEWEHLPEEYREANRAQADDIITKLGRFGYGFDTGETFFETVTEFPMEKLDEMAQMEHLRWCQQRRAAGWTYAPGAKDDVKKTSPYLVEWEELDAAAKELDYDVIRNIIPMLGSIGLRVYRRD